VREVNILITVPVLLRVPIDVAELLSVGEKPLINAGNEFRMFAVV
jgi:hypothetical protein